MFLCLQEVGILPNQQPVMAPTEGVRVSFDSSAAQSSDLTSLASQNKVSPGTALSPAEDQTSLANTATVLEPQAGALKGPTAISDSIADTQAVQGRSKSYQQNGTKSVVTPGGHKQQEMGISEIDSGPWQSKV